MYLVMKLQKFERKTMTYTFPFAAKISTLFENVTNELYALEVWAFSANAWTAEFWKFKTVLVKNAEI